MAAGPAATARDAKRSWKKRQETYILYVAAFLACGGRLDRRYCVVLQKRVVYPAEARPKVKAPMVAENLMWTRKSDVFLFGAFFSSENWVAKRDNSPKVYRATNEKISSSNLGGSPAEFFAVGRIARADGKQFIVLQRCELRERRSCSRFLRCGSA